MYCGPQNYVCSFGWQRVYVLQLGKELLVPQLCGQNSDERLIFQKAERPAGPATAHQSGDRVGVEPTEILECCCVQQRIAVLGRLTVIEKCTDIRSAIRLLAAFRQRIRQMFLRPTVQNVFFLHAAQTRASGQCGRKREKPMIEEWESTLDAVRHTHTISLRAQQIARQQRADLEVRCALQPGPPLEVGRQAVAQLLQHIGATYTLAHAVAVEILDA